MKLSDLLSFLEEKGARPQKRLSQNFLVDANISHKIVRTADVRPNRLVLEIGPGPGALTKILLAEGCRLVAIEKDPIFATSLKTLENVTVFQEDILTFSLRKFLAENLGADEKAQVVANLPYHITSPILERLLPLHDKLSSLTLMVQKEVADRLTAKPGSSDYSHMTLFSHFFSEPTLCFTVPRTCFYPKPKVDSAIVHFSLREPPLSSEQQGAFFQMTRAAFQQRRKMLRSSLKKHYPTDLLLQAFTQARISPETRPEQLSLEQFLLLFEKIFFGVR